MAQPVAAQSQLPRHEVENSYQLADFLVFACILLLGALAFFSRDRGTDFLYDDVYYADCARSLLERGFYGIADRPETTQPPGLSAILAMLCLAGGCTRAVFLGAMCVFETLGFLACYEWLRRQAPRAIAAAICLLLMSSSLYFSLATQWVSTSFPLLFATMSALLAAQKFQKTTNLASRIAWGGVFFGLLAASLMFGSTAIAFLGSIVAWIAMGALRDRQLGMARFKMFAAVLLLGIAVEGLWMHRKPLEEWPLPGFPRPYLQQLQVKDGHNPELGMATAIDFPVRMGKKAFEESALLAQVLFRRWIDPSWASLLISGPAILLVAGWCYSAWETGGGLAEWYFAGGEFILLLWPWRLDPRSFLPFAPLACFYLWRGAEGLGVLAKRKPRLLGALWLPVAACLTFAGWAWIHGAGTSPVGRVGLQVEASTAAWLLSGILAGMLVWKGSGGVDSLARIANWFARVLERLGIKPSIAAKVLGGALVAGLLAVGVTNQLNMRRRNLVPPSARSARPADIEAALWVRQHTDANAIVMARQVPIIYHYSEREMVWFPPSSNAQILMDGIRKYKVNYVILVRRNQNYYLPPEEDCFAAVLARNADAFRLVAETPRFQIYETRTELAR